MNSKKLLLHLQRITDKIQSIGAWVHLWEREIVLGDEELVVQITPEKKTQIEQRVAKILESIKKDIEAISID